MSYEARAQDNEEVPALTRPAPPYVESWWELPTVCLLTIPLVGMVGWGVFMLFRAGISFMPVEPIGGLCRIFVGLAFALPTLGLIRLMSLAVWGKFMDWKDSR